MKSTTAAAKTPLAHFTAVQRGQTATKAMAKELPTEHKRWNLSLH